MKIEFEREAHTELRDAPRWYQRQREGLGFEFLTEVRNGLAQINEHPETWPMLTKLSRRFRLHRFPYWLVYYQKQDVIRIIAVMHQSRRPNYWRKRERGK